MNKFLALIGLVAFFGAGCGKNGSMGNTGPTGPAGPIVVQTNLQNGVFPTSSYNGELDTWLDSGNGTPQNGTSYRRVKIGSTVSSTEPSGNYSRVLFRFDVSSIPVNATIEEARLLLTTQSSSSLGSSSVTVGLHALASILSSGCTWTSSATWGAYSGPFGWSNCDGDSSDGQKGIYDATPLSTVVFNSTFTGTSKVVEYEFPASVVEGWITGTNNGLILVSEGEFQSVPAANVDFYPYNDATATNRPQLIVTYE